MRRGFVNVFAALVAAHVVALPFTAVGQLLVQSEGGRGAAHSHGAGCGGGAPIDPEQVEAKLAASLGTDADLDDSDDTGGLPDDAIRPLIPACPVLNEECTVYTTYYWFECIRILDSPLTCHEFRRPLKRWICPGTSYYTCCGPWDDIGPSTRCTTECSPSTSSTLPSGCDPDSLPSGTVECNGGCQEVAE